nr:polysaccharide deacetylase family protein [Sporosarcina sp. E16_3]
MTFIDDDGRNQVMTKWLPVIQETGLKMTIPIVTGSVDSGAYGYMSWDNIETLKSYGTEICCHTYSHPNLGSIPLEKVREEFEKSTKLLREHGCRDDLLVYPFGVHGDAVRPIVKEFYKVGVDVKEGINTPPVYTHAMLRKTMGEAGANTLSYYKEQLDLAIANNGWLIWKSHSQYETMTPEQMAIIKEFIIYAQDKIDIVTLGDGLDIYGNLIDVGDFYRHTLGSTAPYYYVMDNEGRIHSNEESKQFSLKYEPSIGFGTPVTNFRENMKSVHVIIAAISQGFPTTSGYLETTRYIPSSDSISHQLFYGSNNIVYRRMWNTITNVWGDFKVIGGDSPIQILVPEVIVPPSGTVEVTVTNANVLATSVVDGNPRASIVGGVMFNIIVKSAGNITIRYFNTTDSPITVIARNWLFKIHN